MKKNMRICSVAVLFSVTMLSASCGFDSNLPGKEDFFGRTQTKIDEPHRRPVEQPSGSKGMRPGEEYQEPGGFGGMLPQKNLPQPQAPHQIMTPQPQSGMVTPPPSPQVMAPVAPQPFVPPVNPQDFATPKGESALAKASAAPTPPDSAIYNQIPSMIGLPGQQSMQPYSKEYRVRVMVDDVTGKAAAPAPRAQPFQQQRQAAQPPKRIQPAQTEPADVYYK